MQFANRGAGGFRIENDLRRHFQVCRLIDINVAVAHTCFNHRHGCMLHHCADQPAAAPGDQYIHIRIEPHQLIGGIARRIRHELDAILREAPACSNAARITAQSPGWNGRLLAAAQNHRIARILSTAPPHPPLHWGVLQKSLPQRREASATFTILQAVRPVPTGEHSATGSGRATISRHALRHACNTGLIQAEAVKQSRAHARLFAIGNILRICLQNRGSNDSSKASAICVRP